MFTQEVEAGGTAQVKQILATKSLLFTQTRRCVGFPGVLNDALDRAETIPKSLRMQQLHILEIGEEIPNLQKQQVDIRK